MLRRVGFAVGGVLILTGFLSGCSGKPIVGVILPTTGAAASYGESIESGIRLALSDARGREGLPTGFEVEWADTGSDPSRAKDDRRARREVGDRRSNQRRGDGVDFRAR